MITKELKQQIDSMNYESMLTKWRFAPVGDPMFQGEVGDYFSKIMSEKKELLSSEEQVQISKDIGWEK
jgi:hypothetical protein